MRLFRLCPEHYLEDYSRLGASYKDGARWNKAGTPVLYYALTPAVALLEMGNYLPSPRLVPKNYRLGIYDLPDTVAYDELADDRLPNDWSLYPYPHSTQRLGNDWLQGCRTLALLVPSTAVPRGLERIAVLNPHHPDRRKMLLVDTTADIYNKRMFGGLFCI